MATRGTAAGRRRRAQKRSERSGGVRWAVLAVVGAALAVGGLALLELGGAARDLRAVEDQLDEVDALVEAGRLGEARTRLDIAFGRADSANGRLYGNPAVDLVGVLPVARQNLQSLRSSVGVGLTLIDSGRRILDAGAPLGDADGNLEVPLRDGAIPVGAVGSVQAELAAASASLPRLLEQRSDRWLLGPVADLQTEVEEEADARARQFRDVADALRVVDELAGGNGPRRFLIAVANTAEMRGTGGMVLSYGILDSADGDFTLGAFGRIDELALPGPLDPEAVELPEDYLRRWDGFDVTERWRNATAAADLTLVAPTLLQMFEAATGTVADGVIQIDPAGLAAILEGTGPVTVPELGRVGADDVVDLTLNEAYFRFPDIEARSDVLSDVAEATFDRLVNGDYPSLRPLAEALLRASNRRHLAMYSTASDVQAVLARFGAAAGLPPADSEYLHLGVQNVSGNKLDYYVDTALALSGSRPAGEVGDLTAEITVSNDAPAGVATPRYVFGPFNEDQAVGVYRGIVTLYVPRGTTLVKVGGDRVVNPPVVQTEDGRTVISYTVAVDAGARSAVTLDLRFPPRPAGAYGLLGVPVGRVNPIGFRVDVDVDGTPMTGDVVLDRPTAFAPGVEPAPLPDPEPRADAGS